MGIPKTSRWFTIYSTLLLTAGVLVFVASGLLMPVHLTVAILVLMFAALISENAALPLPGGGTTSLAFPMSTAAAFLFGPTAAALVALCSTVTRREFRAGLDAVVVASNAGQLLLSSTLPAWFYVLLGGRPLLSSPGEIAPLSASDFPRILIPIAAYALGTFAVNTVLVSIGVSLRRGIPALSMWRSSLAWTFPIHLSLVVLGIVVAQVLTVHPVAFALLVFPLVVSRQIYRNYLGLKHAYLDTVRSLVAALEAKDPYTRGHSERVATYAELMAERAGLSEERIARLRIAAQLHDVGKLAIPNTVLQKPGGLTAGEYEQIRMHPDAGAEIVSAVSAIDDLASIVRHHHEHYDGTGYGWRLARDEIPLESRLLAIADSFDAMTTARAYREAISIRDAVEEIRRCAGTQFDPMLVDCFIEVASEGVER